jgi:MFS family permease
VVAFFCEQLALPQLALVILAAALHRVPNNPVHPPEPPSPTRSGRKRAALTYCLAYTLGCFTKHFNSFWILAGGRVLCGIATSLLFSAFESWLVAEHFKVGGWLGGWRGGGGAVSGWLGR